MAVLSLFSRFLKSFELTQGEVPITYIFRVSTKARLKFPGESSKIRRKKLLHILVVSVKKSGISSGNGYFQNCSRGYQLFFIKKYQLRPPLYIVKKIEQPNLLLVRRLRLYYIFLYIYYRVCSNFKLIVFNSS